MSMYPGGPYPPPPPQPYAGYPGGPGFPPVIVAAPENGMGVAALIVGIIALLSSWTVIGGLALGVLALIFGLIGHSKAKKGLADNGVMAVIGLVLGVLAAVISVVIIVYTVAIFNQLGFSEYMDCSMKANGNQLALERCQEQFKSRINEHFGVDSSR
ncbi:DUF4190 domain-containing protein [Mycobacterium sp. OTB74]|jgi:hypothetical protein|uniref:DUF4190 domain-containing protein n=1 Tax=Mycobacterium sp. OTB74 TaxID=1853452 RepID=UPI0024739F20|nr:DUF4190 domain-containing protein [Mycobacterium sp. OTB74]MDH6247826.1 putative membrane protein [Mycobacterium sp. OTB74]